MAGTRYALRDLYVEHSEDPAKPCWHVCADQSGSTARVDYAGKIKETALEHPEWSMRRLAQHLHCSVGIVNRHYPDDLRGKKK